MARKIIFTFRMTKEERQALNQVAAKLKRSASDAIRYLIQYAASVVTKSKDGPDEKID